MRVILQMFGFRFEESVSSSLSLFSLSLSASAKLVPARCADLCQQFRLPGSVSSLFPFTYPCSLVISVDRHAVCCRHGIWTCVCVSVCVWSAPACAQFTYGQSLPCSSPSAPLWIIFPVCLMSTWLSSILERLRKCLGLPRQTYSVYIYTIN